MAPRQGRIGSIAYIAMLAANDKRTAVESDRENGRASGGEHSHQSGLGTRRVVPGGTEKPVLLDGMISMMGIEPLTPARAPADNPLIRSALLLSGAALAAQSPDSHHDGVVTADEVRSMNLGGTQLVVLSACQTGTGSLEVGEGVYGLRRAFFVAGTETLVVSLWQVADKETGELMKEYYLKLKHGQGRVTALQQAMEEMAGKKPHPYYWAPFIALGRDEPLH